MVSKSVKSLHKKNSNQIISREEAMKPAFCDIKNRSRLSYHQFKKGLTKNEELLNQKEGTVKQGMLEGLNFQISSGQRCKSVEDIQAIMKPEIFTHKNQQYSDPNNIFNLEFNKKQFKDNQFYLNDEHIQSQSGNLISPKAYFLQNGRCSSMDFQERSISSNKIKKLKKQSSQISIQSQENEILSTNTSKEQPKKVGIEPKDLPISCRFEFIKHQQAYLLLKDSSKQRSIINPQILMGQYRKQLNTASNPYLSSFETEAYKSIAKQMRKQLSPLICYQIQKKISKLDKFEQQCNNDLGNQNIHTQAKKEGFSLSTLKTKAQSKDSIPVTQREEQFVFCSSPTQNTNQLNQQFPSQTFYQRETKRSNQINQKEQSALSQNFVYLNESVSSSQDQNQNLNNNNNSQDSARLRKFFQNKYSTPDLTQQRQLHFSQAKQQAKCQTDQNEQQAENQEVKKQFFHQKSISQQFRQTKSIFQQKNITPMPSRPSNIYQNSNRQYSQESNQSINQQSQQSTTRYSEKLTSEDLSIRGRESWGRLPLTERSDSQSNKHDATIFIQESSDEGSKQENGININLKEEDNGIDKQQMISPQDTPQQKFNSSSSSSQSQIINQKRTLLFSSKSIRANNSLTPDKKCLKSTATQAFLETEQPSDTLTQRFSQNKWLAHKETNIQTIQEKNSTGYLTSFQNKAMKSQQKEGNSQIASIQNYYLQDGTRIIHSKQKEQCDKQCLGNAKNKLFGKKHKYNSINSLLQISGLIKQDKTLIGDLEKSSLKNK